MASNNSAGKEQSAQNRSSTRAKGGWQADMEITGEVPKHEMLGDPVANIRAQGHLPDDPFDSSESGEDDDGPSTFTTDRNAPPPSRVGAAGFFHDRKEVPAETQWSSGKSINAAHMHKLKIIRDEENLRGVYEDDKSGPGGSSNKKAVGSGGKHGKKHWYQLK